MMTEKNFAGYNDKDKKPNKRNNMLAVLFFRWFFLAFIIILALPGINMKANGFALIETIAVAVIYNGAISLYTINNVERVGKSFAIILYFDVIMLTIFSFFSGGINSDIYVLLFFLLGLCGKFNDAAFTIRLGIFCAILFLVSSICHANINTEKINYIRLAVKDMLLILGAYGISRINHEVKRYDELRKREFKIARTDKLTGLANRHYFDQKLGEEVEYANNNNATLNVLMFDLDNFKGFNDTYGHVSGDKLLMLFSDIIKQCIRKSDIPVRYGGEEFLILVRDLDIIIAKSIGDRIRRQLEKQRLYLGEENGKKKVTVSCGLAQYPMHSNDIKQVIEFADQALYHAKEAGKNMVVTHGEIGQ